jgi:hypothetical protein
LDAENVVIFDDIRWSEDMKDAWQSIQLGSEAYDLGPIGACVNVGTDGRMAPVTRQRSATQGQ